MIYLLYQLLKSILGLVTGDHSLGYVVILLQARRKWVEIRYLLAFFLEP